MNIKNIKRIDFFVKMSKKDVFLMFLCFIFVAFMLWVNFVFFALSDKIKSNTEKVEEIQADINKLMIKAIEEKNRLYSNSKEKNDKGSKYKISYLSNEDARVMIDSVLNENLIKIKAFSSQVKLLSENEKFISKDKIYRNLIVFECVGLVDDLIMVINILESMPWFIKFEKINISSINEKSYLLHLELNINSVSDNVIQFFGKKI